MVLKLAKLIITDLKIGVIGLGYVGLPIAVEFAKKFEVIGFDINESKVKTLKTYVDPSKEIETEILKASTLRYTSDILDLESCNFYVVAVPTPVDKQKIPDLTALRSASQLVGQLLKKNDYVVFN